MNALEVEGLVERLDDGVTTITTAVRAGDLVADLGCDLLSQALKRIWLFCEMTQKRGRCKCRCCYRRHVQAAKLIDNQLVGESIFVSKEYIKKIFLIFNLALDSACFPLCNIISDKGADCEAVVCGNSLVLREASSAAGEEGHDWLKRVE